MKTIQDYQKLLEDTNNDMDTLKTETTILLSKNIDRVISRELVEHVLFVVKTSETLGYNQSYYTNKIKELSK